MIKIFIITFSLGLTTSFNHAWDQSISNSPSPHGDTRIGADAASSGTNISDKDIQAQEDHKGTPQPHQGDGKKSKNEPTDNNDHYEVIE